MITYILPSLMTNYITYLALLVGHSWFHWYKQCVIVHKVSKCMSCHKAIVVIMGRAYCLDDIYIYIYIYIYILTRRAYFLYLIMKTMYMPGYHHNSFVKTHALEHMICDYTWLLTMNQKCSPSKVRNIM